MSSTYRVICLSHDPGLTVPDPETQDHALIEMWLRRGSAVRDQRLPGHGRCDLVAGRFSYPMIEVFCPGGTPDPRRPRHGAGEVLPRRRLGADRGTQGVDGAALGDGRDVRAQGRAGRVGSRCGSGPCRSWQARAGPRSVCVESWGRRTSASPSPVTPWQVRCLSGPGPARHQQTINSARRTTCPRSRRPGWCAHGA